jgi:hypothetical protein
MRTALFGILFDLQNKLEADNEPSMLVYGWLKDKVIKLELEDLRTKYYNAKKDSEHREELKEQYVRTTLDSYKYDESRAKKTINRLR